MDNHLLRKGILYIGIGLLIIIFGVILMQNIDLNSNPTGQARFSPGLAVIAFFIFGLFFLWYGYDTIKEYREKKNRKPHKREWKLGTSVSDEK